MLSSNIVKLLLLQLFFVYYVFARYPFISSQFIAYGEYSQVCGSFTWIPLSPPKNNCDKKVNPFRTYPGTESDVETLERKNVRYCLDGLIGKMYFFDTMFDKRTLHDIIVLCVYVTGGKCEDLEAEVNIDEVWKQITEKTPAKKECYERYDRDRYIYYCPFSSLIDLQYYNLHNEKLRRTGTDLDESKMCTDRFGRKYPIPEGLGGKCVMFQHEFQKDGKTITEFFMPFEKRDFVQRIAEYPYTHEIRQNKTTLNRLLPRNVSEQSQESDCMILHIGKETFIHCVYDPEDFEKFHLSKSNYFYCPKKESISEAFNQSDVSDKLIDFANNPVYTYRNITDRHFEFSEYCYISTSFTPTVNLDDISIKMEANFLGSINNDCPYEKSVITPNSTMVYVQEIIKSMEAYCPWEDGTTYTLCFQTTSENHMSLYLEAMNAIASSLNFSHCFYQVNSGDACYYQIDSTNGQTSRIPSKWIPLIESGNLTSTKKKDGCGTVYITPEMKKECYVKSNKEEYSVGSNIIICKCTTRACDKPQIKDRSEIESYTNELVCNQGSSETVHPSPFFFCSVRLTIKPENGKKVKVFNYSNVNPNQEDYPIKDLLTCWDYGNLTKALQDPEAMEKDITSCFHDQEMETYECCCFASDTPCNTKKIAEDYYKLVNQASEENENRIRIGCDFKAQISSTTNETCSKDYVLYDRGMRCYGVFEIPTTTHNHKNVKPTLIKENCYWPHPQYHDEYSVFCSKHFFDIDDLVEENCLSLFINDFTSTSMKRTLILCCNTASYPGKRESILSRSVVVL